MAKKKESLKIKITWVLLILLIISLVLIIAYYISQNRDEYRYLAEEVVDEGEDEDEDIIDWETLLNINGDIVAWIKIPDTNINYPVVQSDNSEYLRKDIYGNYSRGGTLFVDGNISQPFKCCNTIIYGHNMRNGTMFSNLRYYKDETYADEHSIVYIYLPDGSVLQYKVVSFHIVNADDVNIYNPYVDDICDYAQYVFKNNYYNETASLSDGDKLLTLSTCTGSGDTRYVLHCKLIQ